MADFDLIAQTVWTEADGWLEWFQRHKVLTILNRTMKNVAVFFVAAVLLVAAALILASIVTPHA